MYRYVTIFLMIAAFAAAGFSVPQEDTAAVLNRSESLYYDAKFKESIELLEPLDAALASQPDQLQQRISIKLRLALGYIGLNDTQKAKTSFVEMCALDPACSLDSQQFSPKVVDLFNEAKAQYAETNCRTICQRANTLLEAGDLAGLEETAAASGAQCGCVRAVVLDSAELYFTQGLDAYREEDFAVALHKFRDTLKLNGDHPAAAQYVELTQSRLRLAIDHRFLDWRKDLDAGDFARAAGGYRELEMLNVDGVAAKQLQDMRTEYQTRLAALHESWMRACALGDRQSMDLSRARAMTMLPDVEMGRDTLNAMTTCLNKVCVQMDPQAAMLRVRSSQRPEISAAQQRALQTPLSRTVNVKVRIEEDGSVLVLEARGENTSVNTAVTAAVERWTFSPAVVQGEARCVEATLPIVISPASAN